MDLLNNSEKLIIKKSKKSTTNFEKELEINKNNFQRIIPILITQESLGMMALENKFDCLAYSIDDLIIFRDILQTSIQLLDFFAEHLLFNKKYKNITFIGNVIDTLEYYLLNQLHNNDYEVGTTYILGTDNNHKITEYMVSLLCNKEVSPPKMDLQVNIKFLIEALDKLKPENYMTLGSSLMESTLEFENNNNYLSPTLEKFYKSGISNAGFIVKKQKDFFEIYMFHFFDSSYQTKHNSVTNQFQEYLKSDHCYYFNKKKRADSKGTIYYFRYNKRIFLSNNYIYE